MSTRRLIMFVLAATFITSCGSSSSGPAPITAQYNLELTLEKDGVDSSNYFEMDLTRNDSSFKDWLVVLDGDTVRPCGFACVGRRQMPSTWWEFGHTIKVAIIDTLIGFIYRDSVKMPGEISIAELRPTDRIWNGDSVYVRWDPVTSAVHYGLSVRHRSITSSAPGLGVQIPEGQYSYKFGEWPFHGPFGSYYSGTYLVRVVCSSTNFVWNFPWFETTPPPWVIDQPIDAPNITGVISAIVASDVDSIMVD